MLLTLAYVALGIVVLNIIFAAPLIRALLHSSPRARAGASIQPPDRAPAPAGRIEPEWWLR